MRSPHDVWPGSSESPVSEVAEMVMMSLGGVTEDSGVPVAPAGEVGVANSSSVPK